MRVGLAGVEVRGRGTTLVVDLGCVEETLGSDREGDSGAMDDTGLRGDKEDDEERSDGVTLDVEEDIARGVE